MNHQGRLRSVVSNSKFFALEGEVVTNYSDVQYFSNGGVVGKKTIFYSMEGKMTDKKSLRILKAIFMTGRGEAILIFYLFLREAIAPFPNFKFSICRQGKLSVEKPICFYFVAGAVCSSYIIYNI